MCGEGVNWWVHCLLYYWGKLQFYYIFFSSLLQSSPKRLFCLFLTCLLHLVSTFWRLMFLVLDLLSSLSSSPPRHTFISETSSLTIGLNPNSSFFFLAMSYPDHQSVLFSNKNYSPTMRWHMPSDGDKIKNGCIDIFVNKLSMHLLPNILDV